MKKRNTIWIVLCLTFLSFMGYYFYPEKQLKSGQKADTIIIYKKEHKLFLFQKNELMATYKVSLSKKGLAKKNEKRRFFNTRSKF